MKIISLAAGPLLLIVAAAGCAQAPTVAGPAVTVTVAASPVPSTPLPTSAAASAAPTATRAATTTGRASTASSHAPTSAAPTATVRPTFTVRPTLFSPRPTLRPTFTVRPTLVPIKPTVAVVACRVEIILLTKRAVVIAKVTDSRNAGYTVTLKVNGKSRSWTHTGTASYQLTTTTILPNPPACKATLL